MILNNLLGLKVSRSTYYQSKHESKKKCEKHRILERIVEFYFESSRRYDVIKLYYQLIQEGFLVSLKRIQRLM